MKTGIIDVGGGFRDIYGAGILDVCLEQGIHFDYCIGISAGSANMASYMAGQHGRNYTFYMEYVFRKAYASPENWLKTRNYVDLDYVYSTLSGSGGENPIDYPALRDNPAELYVGACDARTGKPVYFDKSMLSQDHYDIFKASSALPVFCKPVMIGDIPCLDGGISDPIPVLKALGDGCDRVVVILTRPTNEPRVQKKDVMIAKILRRSYPAASERMLMRYKLYNDSVAYALEMQREGHVLVVAPDDVCGLSTLTKDREKLQQMYDKGRRDAQAIRPFLEKA